MVQKRNRVDVGDDTPVNTDKLGNIVSKGLWQW